MEIYIEKLKKQDAEELFAFESYNRTFLKRWYRVVVMITMFMRRFNLNMMNC